VVLYSVLIKEHFNCIRYTARNNKLQKDRKDVEDVCVVTYFNKLHLYSIVTRINAGCLGNRRSVLDGGKYEGWNFNTGNYLFTTDTK